MPVCIFVSLMYFYLPERIYLFKSEKIQHIHNMFEIHTVSTHYNNCALQPLFHPIIRSKCFSLAIKTIRYDAPFFFLKEWCAVVKTNVDSISMVFIPYINQKKAMVSYTLQLHHVTCSHPRQNTSHLDTSCTLLEHTCPSVSSEDVADLTTSIPLSWIKSTAQSIVAMNKKKGTKN